MSDVTPDDRFALPPDLPFPEDDGAADHLSGTTLPGVALQTTDGSSMVTLAELAGRTVVFAYPKTGDPGKGIPDGWDMIPGARGCTPQACAFRDLASDFARHDVRLFGLSTQGTDYQREVTGRLHLPYALLSDDGLMLADSLGLPTFAFEGETLLKRLAMVIDDGVITTVFYPVFPPDRNAPDVLAWLDANPRGDR